MLQVSKPFLGPLEEAAILRVMRGGFLGQGPEVALFEQELAQYLGGKNQVVCCNSGTSALHLAIAALGIGPGDEVLVPSITFVASYQAVSATGATPISCEVLESTMLIDLEDAARKVTVRTRAIMPVHYMGQPISASEIRMHPQLRELSIVEDAAHSFGSRIDGQLVGSDPQVITCFSFDPIKNITCGEGGAVVTSQPDVAKRIREIRRLGLLANGDVTEQGWRYHMTDMNAAIGRIQLSRLENEFKAHRQYLWKIYLKELGNIPFIKTLEISKNIDLVPHIFVVKVKKEMRSLVIAALKSKDIETRLHYLPNHALQKYSNGIPLPVSEQMYQEILTLPLHMEVTDAHVKKICEAIRQVSSPADLGRAFSEM